MKNTGWRKQSPGLAAAEEYAQAGELLSIPKSRAVVAAKKVAAALGLKAQDLLLLDTLSAFTRPQDWEEGRRPIVWPSNGYLVEHTGFSLPTVQRHIRRLAEAGLLFFKDSSNGKRWGSRDGQGYIVQSYGLDLSPLAARTDEFEALWGSIKEDRAHRKSLRHDITVGRRSVRARIDQAGQWGIAGIWIGIRSRLDAILADLPGRNAAAERLAEVREALRDLDARVSMANASLTENVEEKSIHIQGLDCCRSLEMIPRHLRDETHIPYTSQLHSVTCSLDPDPETELCQTSLTVPTLLSACPQFAEMSVGLGAHINGWEDLHRAAGKLGAMAGIARSAWDAAQSRLGPRMAAAAVALIFDKYTDGEITSPGGYLRGMIRKSKIGELDLDRSFHGRLKKAVTPSTPRRATRQTGPTCCLTPSCYRAR